MTTKRAYGLWPSPLSASDLAGDTRIYDAQWAADGALVWSEGRDGKGVLVARRPGDAPRDLTRDISVKGGVGYGGGEFTVDDDQVYCCAKDGRLYRVGLDHGSPRPITPPHGSVASPAVAPGGDWVAYVHTDGRDDVIAVVDTAGERWPQKLVSGADFYMQPAWSPDGKRLAWISWDHPHMPWDTTALCMASVTFAHDCVRLSSTEAVAADDGVSVMQPEFSPDGRRLAYLSDRDGWWHLVVRDLESGDEQQVTAGQWEVGGPAWVQGMRAFAWKPDASGLWAVRNVRGQLELISVGVDGGVEPVEAASAYTHVAQLSADADGRLSMLAGASTIPTRLVSLQPVHDQDAGPSVERYSSAERVPASALSEMRPISWTSAHDGAQIEVYGNYYPPASDRFCADGKPPAILMIHGGPTSQRTARFEATNQFFATRGFAVLDVNYRGSTGYGRDYRDALLGQWGVFDVADAVSGAEHLADQGMADPERIAIMGGSAGGYTVLQALVTHPGTFAAGISSYGISNLFMLSMDTHKFESHYNDMLIGELPEATETFRQRSPLFHAERIADPVAIFQGAKDKVVPINQAEAIVETLSAQGTPHVYHVYDDEGHGWRKSETIAHFHGEVLKFLREYMLFA